MPTMSPLKAQNSQPERSILVLEDDFAQRELVKTMLEFSGYLVFEAGNLAQASEVLKSVQIDLVLCDLELEGDEHGTTFLHELAPKSPEIIVVMMTGDSDLRTAINCLREGAFDYLLRPFNLEDLLKVVASCLKRREQRLNAQKETAREMEMLARYASECPDPVMRVQRNGEVVYTNGIGRAMIEIWQSDLGCALPPVICDAVEAACAETTRKQVELDIENRFFSFTIAPIKHEESAYLYGLDITSRVEAEKELIRLRDQAQWMANHDSLTGLPNRKYFEEQMETAFEEAAESGEIIALVLMDLDNFKDINDLYGHIVGDRALVLTAEQLRAAQEEGNFGPASVAGRWGGDELVLLLRHLKSRNQAQPICQTLQNQLYKKIEQKLFFPLSSSMGVAFYPEDGTTSIDLLQRADNSLYAAKAKGPNKIVCMGEAFFKNGLFPFDRATAAGRLQDAIRDQKIEVHYQAIVDCQSRKVVGAEALARWKDDEAGWIPCGAFIPMAEESGLINELGRQVTVKALAELKRWLRAGLDMSVSINISLRQVKMPSFCNNMMQLVKEAGVPINRVILEVTERELIVEIKGFRELNDSGFLLSIDDFGSGYSSLSQIVDMPVRELKIDRDLTRQADTERGCRVLETLVKLGHTLEFRIVAEGIESSSDADLMAEMGVDRLQGYHLTSPLAAEEFFKSVTELQPPK